MGMYIDQWRLLSVHHYCALDIRDSDHGQAVMVSTSLLYKSTLAGSTSYRASVHTLMFHMLCLGSIFAPAGSVKIWRE